MSTFEIAIRSADIDGDQAEDVVIECYQRDTAAQPDSPDGSSSRPEANPTYKTFVTSSRPGGPFDKVRVKLDLNQNNQIDQAENEALIGLAQAFAAFVQVAKPR